jgi:hypothetical protein
MIDFGWLIGRMEASPVNMLKTWMLFKLAVKPQGWPGVHGMPSLSDSTTSLLICRLRKMQELK